MMSLPRGQGIGHLDPNTNDVLHSVWVWEAEDATADIGVQGPRMLQVTLTLTMTRTLIISLQMTPIRQDEYNEAAPSEDNLVTDDDWSPAFPLDVLGSYVLPVPHPKYPGVLTFVRGTVQSTAGVISVVLSSVPEEEMPFKMNNDTAFWVRVKQYKPLLGLNFESQHRFGSPAANDWAWIAPGSEIYFAFTDLRQDSARQVFWFVALMLCTIPCLIPHLCSWH